MQRDPVEPGFVNHQPSGRAFFPGSALEEGSFSSFGFSHHGFKNGLRIVILSLLNASVDVQFLTGGFLHRSGGFLFFIPVLGLLSMALWTLRRKAEGANLFL